MNHKKNKFLVISAFLIMILSVIPFHRVEAQFRCSGSACSSLPYTQEELNTSFVELQRQYTNRLHSKMAEASVIANIAGPPMGTIHLSGYTIGANISSAVMKTEKVDVVIPGIAQFNDVPLTGAAVSPRIYAGLNLGKLFGLDYDPFDKSKRPSMLSPSRFDVYVSGMKIEKSRDKLNKDQNGKGTIKTEVIGGEIRYHLVEGGDILWGPFLRFRGVSFGAGYYKQEMKVAYIESKFSDIEITKVSGQTILWKGTNHINMQTKTETIPVEFRTGLQVLYFANLSLGAGVAFGKGYSEMFLNRTGPVVVKDSNVNTDTYLELALRGRGGPPAHTPYGKLGVELNVPVLKISVEGIATKNAYGVNFGIRAEI